MSLATLLYLKERPVNSKSQGNQFNPRGHNSDGAAAKEQKRPGTIAWHQSKSDTPTPSPGDSAQPNINSSSRGRSLNESAEAHGLGLHTPSHSPLPEHPVQDEGGMAADSSSKELNVDITGNKVTALRTPQRVLRQKELIIGSNYRAIMEMFGATFAHIYYTIRTNPSRSRSSIDALQEVCLFPVCTVMQKAHSCFGMQCLDITTSANIHKTLLGLAPCVMRKGVSSCLFYPLFKRAEHKLSLHMYIVKLQHSTLRPS